MIAEPLALIRAGLLLGFGVFFGLTAGFAPSVMLGQVLRVAWRGFTWCLAHFVLGAYRLGRGK